MRRRRSLPCACPTKAVFLLALKPAAEEVMVADALDCSGSVISVPNFDAPCVDAWAFLAIAFGSNLPAYGAGDAGDSGDPSLTGVAAAAFLSMSSSKLRVPAADWSSFCLPSCCWALTFCFHASSFASRAFLASSSAAAVDFCGSALLTLAFGEGRSRLSLRRSLLLDSTDTSRRRRSRELSLRSRSRLQRRLSFTSLSRDRLRSRDESRYPGRWVSRSRRSRERSRRRW